VEYLFLFGASLLAATLLPFYSEVVLFALLKQGSDPFLLVLSATAGNTIGAGINWVLGLFILRFQHRRWFYFKPKQIAAAQIWFQQYGQWTLLFSWLPIVGDALTLVAGMMRVRCLPFLLLVATGKGLRYMVIAYWTVPTLA
jgi:membrane protein YqaA with SNARE-associated domain